MSENQPANVQLETNNNGTVSFATDVIATIVGLATTEVEGVNSMYGGSSTSLADIFSRRGNNTKGLTRGVRVDMADNALSVAVTIIVDYGFPVPDIAKSIQENVKKAVETMSGLSVTSVNVHVQGVNFEREMKAAAEIEEQQRLLLQRQQEEDSARDAEQATAGEPAQQDHAQEAPAPAEAEQDDDNFELDLEDDEPDLPEEGDDQPDKEGGEKEGEA